MSEFIELKTYFNQKLVNELARSIKSVYSIFDEEKFEKACLPFDVNQALMERSKKVKNALNLCLPIDFALAGKIIIDSFEIQSKPSEEVKWMDFMYFPIGQFIEENGCEKEYLPLSFQLIEQLTIKFTAEFCIRKFISRFPKETITKLNSWVNHPNHHVRRLVSEGTRPRLPWASQLNQFIKDPTPTLAFLELLKEDESKYVQKSVANHLNDITKDHPQLVLSILEQWNKSENPNTKWIIRHALRNELKKGNPTALKIMGFDPDIKIKLIEFNIHDKEIKIGGHVSFTCTIELEETDSKEAKNLMIDYNVYYKKANGNLTPKTFKLSSKKLKNGEQFTFSKKQSFKVISTRTFHPGEHKIEIQINGKKIISKSFELFSS